MNLEAPVYLERFLRGTSIEERWIAARELMAAKELAKHVGQKEFERAFAEIGIWARDYDGIERLLSVDLIVRIYSFAKKLRNQGEHLLKAALYRELPPLSLAADATSLPSDAKAAEIRENVAAALAFSSGHWVREYIVRSLAEEDRSQRCRVELLRRLCAVDPNIDAWIESLLIQPSLASFLSSKGQESGVSELRDICSAVADVLGQNRNLLSVSSAIGPLIGRLASMLIQVSTHSPLPARIDLAAIEIARLPPVRGSHRWLFARASQ